MDELKPVDQTVLGLGNPRANCFQACLAMLTGLPIEQCFDITDPGIEDGQWVAPLEAWAATHGLRFMTGIKAPKDRPYIANGPTEKREGVHGVVCIGNELFHDPHPSREGIVSANWYGWFEPDTRTPDPEALIAIARAMQERCERVAGVAKENWSDCARRFPGAIAIEASAEAAESISTAILSLDPEALVREFMEKK